MALIKSKSEVEALAKKLVAADARVLAPTIAELEAMDYRMQLEQSIKMSDDAHYQAAMATVDPKHYGLFTNTVRDNIRVARGSKVHQHEMKRRGFRALKAAMSAEKATEVIRGIIDSFHLRGAVRIDNYSGVTVEVRRGNCEATLYVRLETDYDSRVANPDDPSEYVVRYGLKTTISWSSTSRDIATATVAVSIYQDLIQLAAEVESTMRTERITYVHGSKPAVTESTTPVVYDSPELERVSREQV